jgi:hypothetical protein
MTHLEIAGTEILGRIWGHLLMYESRTGRCGDVATADTIGQTLPSSDFVSWSLFPSDALVDKPARRRIALPPPPGIRDLNATVSL